MASVEHVLEARARLGECPVWDPSRQKLDWVDIYNHRIHEFDPASGQDRYFDAGDLPPAIALAEGHRLLVALRNRLAFVNLDDGGVEPLQQVDFADSDTRFNDGKCDARGRFWIGTISQTPGGAALYRYDPDGSLSVMETGLTISNDLGWSPDNRTFYLTDSPRRRIYAYRFALDTGAIADRRISVELNDAGVEPDGMAIDQEGNVWSALWNGWSIVCFDPTGQERQRIALPVQRPTSLAFGGPDFSDLYITSASVGLSQSEIQKELCAGDLFRVSSDVRGLPTHAFSGPRA